MNDSRPIGIFDSGVGGLTVVRAIEEILPSERLVYVGDTARVPYGNKSEATITRYSREIARFLVAGDVKMIVVACNTASAFALETLRRECTVPVLGVIEPGVEAAVAASPQGRIGIIGTAGTIGSGVYQNLILQRLPAAQLTSLPTPLLVPLIEEDWLDHEVTALVLREYLRPMEEAGVDTLVLACTHYPLLKPVLSRLLGPGRILVDSAFACAQSVRRYLHGHGMLAATEGVGGTEVYLTDLPAHFGRMAERFLKHPVRRIEKVALDSV
ncbi:MAG: glutamate racemase [Candidatus Methylacidiphilales bacterium]|nr:glutamate racemase [Candidatus Methylacidiphilales bacterium]